MNNDLRNVYYCIGVIIAMILIGTVTYWIIEPEWDIIQCFYFTIYTLTTVGYGNLAPSPENRMFTSIFIMMGCTVTLASIAIIGNWLVSVVQKGNAQRNMERQNASLKEKLGLNGHDVEGHLDTIHGDLSDSMKKM